MERLKRAVKQFETAMMAVAFAEEGEIETARTMVRRERRVLLAVKGGQIDGRTFRYAANTCRRIGADLDVLYVSPGEGPDPVLEQRLSEIREEGIRYRLQKERGCLKEAIIDYTASKKEVLFVITGFSDNLEIDCRGRGKKLSEAWQRLRCPLVVVADNG